MPNKKIICVLLLLSFILSLASPVLATPEERKLERVYSLLPLDDKPLAKPGKPATTSVSIRNIASGDTVYSQVLIIAQAAGTFDLVKYQIDSGEETSMARVDSTDRYQATWDTTGLSDGHTLTVKAKSGESIVASASVSVTVVSSYQWEVYYEIDYMIGHEPSTLVLDYMVNYWKGHAIKVTYLIDNVVFDPTPTDGYISSADFWTIENQYNYGADNSQNGYAYTSNEKWMLYGTKDSNSNVGGYTYVGLIGKDLVAGNYIFIADAMIDAWEGSIIPSDGGEVIATCHEAGHSIGIAVLRGTSEKYDPDAYSIMSYMRLQNAKDMTYYWYYSKEYWSTANLNYYPYP
ncbi:zinc-dependent metalloprotease [Candidatus Bathyarchaeota archaeon]|nr:zinc-dependent metalloprotease [Candidatus Bathyarchaeota archaeon]